MSDGKRFGIFGQSGMGKSVLMNQLLRPCNRLVLFDYLETRDTPAKQESLVHLRSIAEVRDYIDKHYSRGFRIWYQPPEDNQVKALHELSVLLRNIQKRVRSVFGEAAMVTLAVDELAQSYPNERLKKGFEGFGNLCMTGRHHSINVVCAAQRMATVNTTLRGNLDEYFFLGLRGPADMKVVEKMTGSEQVAMRVSGLQSLEFIHQKDGEFFPGKAKIPKEHMRE